MRVVESGKIVKRSDGLYISGFVIDCEGGAVDLSEFEMFCKVLGGR